VSADGPDDRIVLRPLASPLPLGFLALAAGTLLLAGLQLGWVEKAEGHRVALIILAFVVPLQGLASILGFPARDVAVGTGMGILSGTWAATAIATLDEPPGGTSDALGLFLITAGAALLVPAAVAATQKLVPAAVMATAAARFALTGVANLTGSVAWRHAAGIVGVVLAVLAFYAAAALAIEDGEDRAVLPVLRRGGDDVAREPGVRGGL
jgi:succinate-acetate transporter protein